MCAATAATQGALLSEDSSQPSPSAMGASGSSAAPPNSKPGSMLGERGSPLDLTKAGAGGLAKKKKTDPSITWWKAAVGCTVIATGVCVCSRLSVRTAD